LPLLWRIGLWRVGDFAAMRPHQTMWNALGEFFPDPRLRQLFGRYATYCGSSPYDAPATLMLIAHVEATGVWLIDGGIHALAEALRGVAEGRGARFRMGTPVAQILTERGKGATGVRLANGDQISADAVICNADPNAIATGCFGEHSARSVASLPPAKRSLSAMVWFAHTETGGFDLTHHNVFFSPDYQREFDQIARGEVPSDPSVYVCAQDRSGHLGGAAELAAKHRERIQIIVNAPANGDTHPYPPEETARCTQEMRATLERCGLTLEQDMPHTLASPAEWERLFPATGGALYGRASHGSAASFLRQGPRTRMPGLYCAGGATHPSAGVPMAALSGLLAAKKVDADLSSMRRSSRVVMPGGTSMQSARTGATG
jgi:1-hydroxycarotenoid 3,4-desaturase